MIVDICDGWDNIGDQQACLWLIPPAWVWRLGSVMAGVVSDGEGQKR
jgi:hypothetical protein